MGFCIDPIPLVNPVTGHRFFARCGRCASCLESRRQQWKFRLMKELHFTSLATHATLTFDNGFLGDNILAKRDLQLFYKRLRNEGVVFRYYSIGEYGTDVQRKHYHVLLFVKNFRKNEFNLLEEIVRNAWPYGFVYFKKVRTETLGYVLHYHIRPKLVNDKPTFQLFSKGLGSEWFDNPEVEDFVRRSSSLRVQGDDGQFYQLPRYYVEKLQYDYVKLDPPAKTRVHDAISHMAKKPYYELSKSQLMRYYFQLYDISYKKLQKYNKQDKL